MYRPLTAAAAVLIIAAPASGQDVAKQIDEIFSWSTPEAPGCVVAVAKDGRLAYNRAYGAADVDRRIPLEVDTRFDAGSLQKQFVAAAVLLLDEQGRLSITDDVRKHIPELPEYGHTITIDHLLTHTSGLRDWIALGQFSGAEEDALSMIVRQRGLNFTPGTEWSYSNSGYVLLKEIVARVSGMPFGEFARTRLFRPLGMQHTAYVRDIQSVERSAIAYEKEGDGWKSDMMLGIERGGGALATTAADLIAWNEALSSARLGAFVTQKLEERTRLKNGRTLEYARGLIIGESPGGRVIWHSGSAAAFKSMLARFPEQGLSVAMLCNGGDSTDRMAFTHRILDAYAPGARAAAAAREAEAAKSAAPAVVDVDVSGRAGLFFSEANGEPLQMVANGGRLRIAGGPPLLPLAHDRFRNPGASTQFMSGAEFEIRFVSPDVFELKTKEGDVTRYRRAAAVEPTAAELGTLAGQYESAELKAVFEAAPGEDGLKIRLNGSPPFDFRAVDRDTFMRGRMVIRFVRDGSGQIVGLDYSNPMFRNVRFTPIP